MITGLSAALLTFLQIALSLHVIRYRHANKLAFADSGDEEFMKRKGAHSNFGHYTPMFLILLLVAELGDANAYILLGAGAFFVLGRLMHAYDFIFATGIGKGRVYGMIITFIAMIFASLVCLGNLAL